MNEMIFWGILGLAGLNTLFTIFLLLKKNTTVSLKRMLEYLSESLQQFRQEMKEDARLNREESKTQAQHLRQEMSYQLKMLTDSLLSRINENTIVQKNQLEVFGKHMSELNQHHTQKLDKLFSTIDQKLKDFQEVFHHQTLQNRKELTQSLKEFGLTFKTGIEEFNQLQREKFGYISDNQKEAAVKTEQLLEKMRLTLDANLKGIQEDNAKKLEEMRVTVDEKLQSTLEKRLGESFRLVSERLELVHKSMGEMQSLANGVGDLKRVLSNVKTRGVLGEYQLENILEQLLTPEQYDKNVKTKKDSHDHVEFAIKLPGKDDYKDQVWLPLDAKFPVETYQLLNQSYEESDTANIDNNRKNLAQTIRRFAKDIREKYVDPPYTTDFAIMFLPIEGLYAEVLRQPGLFESIQRDFRVIITGPTTLSALLNSLQMGFRTLAIEKRSSEVWQILGAVKSEFGKFGAVLEKTQKKLLEASNVIEKANVRTRAIERQLRDVEEMPVEESTNLLDEAFESPISGSTSIE